MTLRIERIKVNRGGPLENDFDFEPGDLNLIYGQNETGKTYVVESLIRFLFRTGKKAPVAQGLRDWDIAGSAMVSGLEEDPVSFSKTDKKLEDYWEDETDLPHDLSRLLVVRAGETPLAEGVDGVGRDLLKAYLSGEGLLDGLADRVESVITGAEVQDGRIVGAKMGKLKTRTQLEDRVDGLETLLKEVEEGYASGKAYSLRKKTETIGAQVNTLGKARRYHAGRLAAQIQGLSNEKRQLPTESELAKATSDIENHGSTKAKIGSKSETLNDLESTSADFQWVDEALGVYKDVTSGAAGSGPNQAFMLLALLALIASVAFGLLGLRIPAVVAAGLSLIFGAITYRDMRAALSNSGDNTELEKLKTEYLTRFGADLTDRAALQAKREELHKNQILAGPLRKELDTLKDELPILEGRIADNLKAWTNIDVPVQEWRDTIRDLKRKSGDLQEQIDSTRQGLTSVGVPDDDYLDANPGEEWAPQRHAALTEDLRIAAEALKQEENKLELLKARVSQETSLESSDWEELITALRDLREGAGMEYRELTAEILAKIQVHTIIHEFREEEDSMIAEGLRRDELTGPLHAFTGRYRSIRLDDDKSLILVSDQDEDYQLASMSTGAREQAFLALRIGFASIAMKGETGFLILDDAFQHSDWNRRKNLVAQTKSLVESGWQVFYFTMDDHIEGLFQEVGVTMGDGFRSDRLG